MDRMRTKDTLPSFSEIRVRENSTDEAGTNIFQYLSQLGGLCTDLPFRIEWRPFLGIFLVSRARRPCKPPLSLLEASSSETRAD